MQCRPHDLRGVDDPSVDQVLVDFGLGVEAVFGVGLLPNLRDDDRPFLTSIGGDPTHRLFQSAPNDVHADLLVTLEFEIDQGRLATQQCDAAPGNDALLDRGLGRVHGVLDPGLLLFHLGFGGRANLDDGHAADQLRQPLLQLLAVVVRRGFVDLRADLLDPAFDGGVYTLTLDDGGVVLVDRDLLGFAEILDLDVLELQPEVLGDGLATGEHRDVFKHRLPPVAEPRRLDGGALQCPAQLVDDERGERLTVDILSHNQEGPVKPRDLLEQRQEVLHRADLLLVNENDRILEHNFHALRVGDEIG